MTALSPNIDVNYNLSIKVVESFAFIIPRNVA